MNRISIVAYSASLSVVSFGLGVFLTTVIANARNAIHAMVGDKPLPLATMVGLSVPPVFHFIGGLFLIFAAAAAIRPSWSSGLAHALLLTLMAKAAAIFFCLAGVTVFFSILGNARSPI